MQERKDLYSEKVEKICKDLDLDPPLMMAIISVESSWNPLALRYEPKFSYSLRPKYYAQLNGYTEFTERQLQKFSWGLGQIMGATARSLGYDGPLNSLSSVDSGCFWAAKYLKRICDKYSSPSDRISAYNEGTPKKYSDGSYINQEYVDKVLKFLHEGKA